MRVGHRWPHHLALLPVYEPVAIADWLVGSDVEDLLAGAVPTRQWRRRITAQALEEEIDAVLVAREQHCDAHCQAVGFTPIGPEWPSCYFHERLQLYLVVYVDDFKLAGPKGNLKEGWKLIRKGIQTGDPEAVNRFLGCEHIILDATIPVGSNPPHGDIPKPPPKSKPLPKVGKDIDFAKLAQAREASEKGQAKD